ncbi:hypothetical protein GCM10007385_11720 [Tateyamaria omphalii]|nr:hypothetical protein GCM10007385_11720 [Tateyamaria omphalii]
MQNLASGDLLVITADDPAAVVDVPHFCTEAGHTLESADTDGPIQRYTIRKG